MGIAARRFGWVCALLLLLACPAGAQVSAVVTNLADLAAIVASAWSNTFLARIVPPGPNPWRNDLGLVGFSDSFATDGLVGLSQSGATLWPLDVIETTNDEPRVRTYFNATGGIFRTASAPPGYAQPWTTNAYGSPGAWLSGTNLETWYIERDPARQHVALTLIATSSLPAYLAVLSNEAAGAESGGTNVSLLALYSNDIAFVQAACSDGVGRVLLHAPVRVASLDWFRAADLVATNAWQLLANLTHAGDPLVLSWTADSSGWNFAAGDGAVDADGDGLTDARELLLSHTDPQSADSDGDGLNDGQEFLQYASNPHRADSGGDGLNDVWKVANSLDPNAELNPQALAPNGLTYAQLSALGARLDAPVVDVGPNDAAMEYRSASVHAWKVGWTQLDMDEPGASNSPPRIFRSYKRERKTETGNDYNTPADPCYGVNTENATVVETADLAMRWSLASQQVNYVYIDGFSCDGDYSDQASGMWQKTVSGSTGTCTYISEGEPVTEAWAGGAIGAWIDMGETLPTPSLPEGVLATQEYTFAATSKHLLLLESTSSTNLPFAQRFTMDITLNNECTTTALLAQAHAELDTSPAVTGIGWSNALHRTNAMHFTVQTGAAAKAATRYLSADEIDLTLTQLNYRVCITNSHTGMLYRVVVAHVFTPANQGSTGFALGVYTYITNGTGRELYLPSTNGVVVLPPTNNGKTGVALLDIGLDVGNGLGGPPDGDADDDGDGFANYLPGMRGTNAVIVFDGTNLTPQHLQLVVRAPGIHHIYVSLETNSHWKGFTTDTVYPGTNVSDLLFEETLPSNPPVQSVYNAGQPGTNGFFVVDLYVYDYGASGRLRIELYPTENATTPFVLTRNLPDDADGDGLADVWEKQMMTEWNTQYGTSWPIDPRQIHPTADAEPNDPDGSGPLGPHSGTSSNGLGDAWSAMEEYRGCWFNSAPGFGADAGFVRLSPARKELMVEVDRMAGAEPTAPDIVSPSEVSSAMSLVKTAFLDTAGVRVLYVMDETGATNVPLADNDARTAYALAHYASTQSNTFWRDKFVWLGLIETMESALLGKSLPNWFGASVNFSALRAEADTNTVSGLLAHVYGIDFERILGDTITHELGHAVGCTPDGEAHRKEVAPYSGLLIRLRPTCFTALTTWTYAYAPGPELQGCIGPWRQQLLHPTNESLAASSIPAVINAETNWFEAVGFGLSVKKAWQFALYSEWIEQKADGSDSATWSVVYAEAEEAGVMTYNRLPATGLNIHFVNSQSDAEYEKEIGEMTVRKNYSRSGQQ